MRVSFCTTCRDRMWQKDAFLTNLQLAVGWADVEFVLIDYGSSDGLREWIVSLPPELTLPLKYYRLEAPSFHSPHAKNVSHLASEGDILVNLDFDNFLVPDYADVVRQVVHDGFLLHNCTRGFAGTYGRIVLTRNDFFLLRGYDESFAPMRYQDTDLLRRAQARGITIGKGHVLSSCIDNVRRTAERYRWHQENMKRGENVYRTVNPEGFGRASLMDLAGLCYATEFPALENQG